MKAQEWMKTTTLSVAALCLMGSLANGVDVSQRGPISFDVYDANKNGFVSQSEFYDARAKRMTIKADQGMPMRNAGNAPDFTLFDVNNDGKLTKTELLQGQQKQFQSNRSNMNKGQRGNNQSMNQGRRNNQVGRGQNMPTFENYDLNNDGYLTQDEMKQARNLRIGQNSNNSTPFANIDTNNDGKVSKVEFLTNQARRR